MKQMLLILLAVLALAGCDRKNGYMGQALQVAPESAKVARDGPARKPQLAYEHQIYVEAPEENIAAIHQAALAACAAAVADECVVLESRLNTGRATDAGLKFRAKPAGIRKLIDALGTQGTVTSKTTTAEDLSGPLEDTARKLEMLQDYRAKLEALRGRAAADIESLIKINKELAQVQAEIEERAGSRAGMARRVDTEILTVNIGSPAHRAFWKPIGNSLDGFTGNLAEGISGVITGLAYLLPWSLVLLVFVWICRRMWTWRRRAKRGMRD